MDATPPPAAAKTDPQTPERGSAPSVAGAGPAGAIPPGGGARPGGAPMLGGGPPQMPCGELRPDLKLFQDEPDDAGNPTWILFDPVSDQYFRMTQDSYDILARWDKAESVDSLYRKFADAGFTTELSKVFEMAAFLSHNDLILPEGKGKVEEKVKKYQAARQHSLFHRFLGLYMSIRIPLWDPDAFLEKTKGVAFLLINRWTLIPLGLVSLLGYIGLCTRVDAVVAEAKGSLTLQGLLQYAGMTVFLKVFHEFAHAYTAKHAGIRVRQMGIAVIFFMPRLFTDLTDGWRVPDRNKKLLMNAAGILFEVLLGGFAALVWWNTGPGLVHYICYYVFAITILNTVLINGNPFIRFDGYYVLMDFFRIDNLNQMGVLEFKAWFRLVFFGIPREDSRPPPRGIARGFLIAFGVSGFVYRFFLYTSIILLIYHEFTKAVGSALFVLELYLFFFMPVVNEAKAIHMRRKSIKSWNLSVSILIVIALLAVLFVPWPWKMGIPCEIRSAKRTLVFAPHAGFLKTLDVADGETVREGKLLFTLQNDQLAFDEKEHVRRLEWSRVEFDQLRSHPDPKQRAGNQIKFREIETVKAWIEEDRKKLGEMTAMAAQDGVFSQYDKSLTLGKWVKEGEAVGEINDTAHTEADAFISEEDLHRVKVGMEVEVRLPDRLASWRGRIRQIIPVSVKDIQSSPLLDVHGGRLPTVQEHSGVKLRDAHYRIQVEGIEGEGVPEVGRSGSLMILRHTSIAKSCLDITINALRRELSF